QWTAVPSPRAASTHAASSGSEIAPRTPSGSGPCGSTSSPSERTESAGASAAARSPSVWVREPTTPGPHGHAPSTTDHRTARYPEAPHRLPCAGAGGREVVTPTVHGAVDLLGLDGV